jgi:hypothetical protein
MATENQKSSNHQFFWGKNQGYKSGSPNIPNLRTFKELIYALNKNKILIQVQKLC